jgi:catechol 2,3-dioxygenase-like lactoylglutathione lyase family enzyme
MAPESPVRETRVALTVQDYEAALRFYRDALGLPVVESWDGPSGRGAVMDAGRATIEVLSPEQSDLVERVEAGGARPDPVRLALEVRDSEATARALVDAGAQAVAEPVTTPWSHRNVRVRAPHGLQLTVFTVLAGAGDG